jgi:hypothetical protein
MNTRTTAADLIATANANDRTFHKDPDTGVVMRTIYHFQDPDTGACLRLEWTGPCLWHTPVVTDMNTGERSRAWIELVLHAGNVHAAARMIAHYAPGILD